MAVKKTGSLEIIEKLRRYKRDPGLANLKEVIPLTTSKVVKVKDLAIDVATQTIKFSLFDSYHDMEPGVRKSLVNLLVRINPDVLTAMKEEIYSADIFKRVRAIQILGLVGKRKYVEQYLVQMIQDTDEKIRATVIRTLGELINKSEANILLALLNDMDERVRANTIEALESLGNQNLIGILSRYRNDSNNRIRGNAIKALYNLGYGEIKAPLEDMLQSSDENMRASGAWVLGEIGKKDPSYVSYVKDVQYADSELVRNNVIRALLKMEPAVSLPYLSALFETSEIDEVKSLYNAKPCENVFQHKGLQFHHRNLPRTQDCPILTI